MYKTPGADSKQMTTVRQKRDEDKWVPSVSEFQHAVNLTPSQEATHRAAKRLSVVRETDEEEMIDSGDDTDVLMDEDYDADDEIDHFRASVVRRLDFGEKTV